MAPRLYVVDVGLTDPLMGYFSFCFSGGALGGALGLTFGAESGPAQVVIVQVAFAVVGDSTVL